LVRAAVSPVVLASAAGEVRERQLEAEGEDAVERGLPICY